MRKGHTLSKERSTRPCLQIGPTATGVSHHISTPRRCSSPRHPPTKRGGQWAKAKESSSRAPVSQLGDTVACVARGTRAVWIEAFKVSCEVGSDAQRRQSAQPTRPPPP